jgi:hypothetical protein
MHTHFVMVDGVARAFSLDDCENCGGEVQAPNGVSFHETAGTLQSLGMTEREKLPAEEHWNEDLDSCSCEACG